MRRLVTADEGSADFAATVSVVIAARNEQSAIALCLASILAQRATSEVIVVDDHSCDGTAQAVMDMGRDHDRVRLLHAPALPAGWIGKSHALHVGVKVARSEYVLFTDGDVLMAGDVIADAVRLMHTEGLDHVGGLFGVECRTLAERVCAPVLSSLAHVALMATSKKLGAGTGAFNMVRRAEYFRAGGHAAIRGQVVDDVALARVLMRHSGRSRLLDTSRDVRVRLFRGWRGYWRCIARSAIPFLGGNRLLAVTLAMLFLAVSLFLCMIPFCVLAVLFGLPYFAPTWSMAFLKTQCVAYVVGYVAILATRPRSRTAALWSIVYPVPLLLMASCILVTAIRQLHDPTVEWRGRVYTTRPAGGCGGSKCD